MSAFATKQIMIHNVLHKFSLWQPRIKKPDLSGRVGVAVRVLSTVRAFAQSGQMYLYRLAFFPLPRSVISSTPSEARAYRYFAASVK